MKNLLKANFESMQNRGSNTMREKESESEWVKEWTDEKKKGSEGWSSKW